MVINEYYNGKWNRGAPKYKRLSDTIQAMIWATLGPTVNVIGFVILFFIVWHLRLLY